MEFSLLLNPNVSSDFGHAHDDEYRILFENYIEIALIVDANGRILRANTAAVAHLEYSRSELLSLSWKQLIAGVTVYSLNLEKEFRERQIFKGHIQLIRKSGSVFSGEASIHSFKTQNEERHYHILLRDVSEKAHLKKLLHEKEISYITLINNIGEGIYHSTENGQFLTVNTALVKMLGYETREEVIKLNLQKDIYVNPYDRMRLKEIAEKEDHARLSCVQWQKKDGSTFEVNLFVRASKDSKGDVKYYEGFVEDLSEKTQLKNQLMHAQRLDLMGSLVGEVAHDFNNMLTVISGNAALIQERDASGEMSGSLRQIMKTCTRAAKLTKRILSFSRNQCKQMQNMSANLVAEGVVKMMESVLKDRILLETGLDTQLANAFIEPSQIEQVLMNLCVNACDAMPDGGVLNVTTKNVILDPEYVREHPWAVEGNYVCVVVRDTGIGMTDDVRHRVFEPFFTTKPVGKGTGLGLSMAYNVIKEHNGYIDIDSTPGKGTTVNVFIPATTSDILTKNK